MGKKLKPLSGKNKIDKNRIDSERCLNSDNQYPAISFRHLTTNKKYDFTLFRDKAQIDQFIDACKHITSTSYVSAMQERKQNKYGWETLDSSQLKFQPKEKTLVGDEKVYIIRFDRQKKRIIGYKDKVCATFYIIGIDHDFNAYQHTKK